MPALRETPGFNPRVLRYRFPSVADLHKEVQAYFDYVESQTEEKPIDYAKPGKDGTLPMVEVKIPYTHAGLAAFLGFGLKELNVLRYDEAYDHLHKYMDWVDAKIEERMIKLGYTQKGNERAFDAVMKNRLNYADKLETKNQNMTINLTFIQAPKDRDEARKMLEATTKKNISTTKKVAVKEIDARTPGQVGGSRKSIPVAEIVDG